MILQTKCIINVFAIKMQYKLFYKIYIGNCFTIKTKRYKKYGRRTSIRLNMYRGQTNNIPLTNIDIYPHRW